MSPGALARLGYVFQDAGLLRTALTHRSAGAGHNERFEFLGDALLGFLVAELLLEHRPGAREGELTRLRARLVREETLAERARAFGLGSMLTLGPGERKSGGARRDSILADAFEALVCAVYLDGGIDACRAFVRAAFEPMLSELPAHEAALKDPKTRLQEWLQGQGLALPEYRLVSTQECSGTAPCFEVECTTVLGQVARGVGTSRRGAEQAAAAALLEDVRG